MSCLAARRPSGVPLWAASRVRRPAEAVQAGAQLGSAARGRGREARPAELSSKVRRTEEGGRGARAPDPPPESAGRSRRRVRRSRAWLEGGGPRIRPPPPPGFSSYRTAKSNSRGGTSRGRAPPGAPRVRSGRRWRPAAPRTVAELRLAARRAAAVRDGGPVAMAAARGGGDGRRQCGDGGRGGLVATRWTSVRIQPHLSLV